MTSPSDPLARITSVKTVCPRPSSQGRGVRSRSNLGAGVSADSKKATGNQVIDTPIRVPHGLIPVRGQGKAATEWGVGTRENLHVVVPCRCCRKEVERTLQIKYGACYLRDVQLDDAIRWSSDDGFIYGRPIKGRGWVCAYSDRCPNCGDESDFADFAVIIDDGVIIEAMQAPMGCRFEEQDDDPGIVPLAADERPGWEERPGA